MYATRFSEEVLRTFEKHTDEKGSKRTRGWFLFPSCGCAQKIEVNVRAVCFSVEELSPWSCLFLRTNNLTTTFILAWAKHKHFVWISFQKDFVSFVCWPKQRSWVIVAKALKKSETHSFASCLAKSWNWYKEKALLLIDEVCKHKGHTVGHRGQCQLFCAPQWSEKLF